MSSHGAKRAQWGNTLQNFSGKKNKKIDLLIVATGKLCRSRGGGLDQW